MSHYMSPTACLKAVLSAVNETVVDVARSWAMPASARPAKASVLSRLRWQPREASRFPSGLAGVSALKLGNRYAVTTGHFRAVHG